MMTLFHSMIGLAESKKPIQHFCIEKALITFECPRTEIWYEYKGECTQPNEISGAYCSPFPLLNVKEIKGHVQPTSDIVNDDYVVVDIYELGSNGFSKLKMKAIANARLNFSCNTATFIVGQPKQLVEGKINSIAEAETAYLLVSYQCLND